MQQRDFGRTGMRVSALGFGAWAIGGSSYGPVARSEALRALARAEELGCNVVDTAQVYGDSEAVLGEFLTDRRERWIVASKYSGQPAGMTATIEDQLRRLRTDRIDFYQIHWMPSDHEVRLFDELLALKRSGKVRAVGVSLKTAGDIDRLLARGDIDAFMLRFGLLDPQPFLRCRQRILDSGVGLVVRSALKEGFLTGKYARDARFDDPQDQRHEWTAERIAQAVDAVDRFRFLASAQVPLAVAAARYVLAFPEVSTLVMGVKSVQHAETNFGQVPADALSPEELARIQQVQQASGLLSDARPWWRRLLRKLRG